MKIFKGALFGALLMAALAGGQAQAETELVSNGGFEQNGGLWGSLTGWTTGAYEFAADTSILDSVHAGSFAAGFSGQALDSMSQSLSTVAGQSYKVSFWLLNSFYATDPDGADGTNQFSVTWGGERVFDAASKLGRVDVPQQGWTHFSFQVTAASSSTSLRFEAFNKYGYFGLDDVSVMAVTAVPEPASLAMLLGGLGVLGVFARRRRLPV